MHRYMVLLFAAGSAVAALSAAPQIARAQGNGEAVRVRVVMPRDPESRARRERLLLRFDSLRAEFERKRLDDTTRDRLAMEMRRTVMALQESLDDATMGRAMAATRARRSAGAGAGSGSGSYSYSSSDDMPGDAPFAVTM